MADLLLTFDPGTPADRHLGAQMAQILGLHYPGHKWVVVVESAQGIATVQHAHLQTNEAWLIKLGDVVNWDDLKRTVVNAGGELLERFGVRRGIADIEQLRHLERFARMH